MKPLLRAIRFLRRLIRRSKRGTRRSLLLTVEGLVFIPLMGAVGFAAINTGANLLYLIFALMAALMTASAISSWMNLRSLDVRRMVPDGVPVDQEARIALELSNRKWFAHSYSLRIVDVLDNGAAGGVAFLFRLPKGKSARIEYAARFARRGRHLFKRIRISSRFPFGFTEKSISWLEPGEILVFPKVFPVTGYLERQGINVGDFESGRKGHGASLFALRDYRSGDSARSIHWKASARRNSLIAREMEADDHHKISLVLDNLVAGPIDERLAENFEHAVSCLASVAAEMLRKGFQVEVITRTGRVPFDVGLPHRKRVLRAMALLELQGARHNASPLALPDSDSSVLFVEYGAKQTYVPGAIRLDATQWPPHAAPSAYREAV